MKMKGSLFSLMLMAMICSGCGLSGEEIVQPKADDVLQALRQQDESVVQIQLKQCQRSNMYEGQKSAHPYLRYDKLKRNYQSTVALACMFIWLPL